MSGIEVLPSDLSLNPKCPHGPTILFSRFINGEKRNFFACSTCRNRKNCTFFLWADEKMNKTKVDYWNQEIKKYSTKIDHQKSFKILSYVKKLPIHERIYCHNCSLLVLPKSLHLHNDHNIEKGLTTENFMFPSNLLKPLESNKKEAQYFFTQNTTETLVNMLKDLQFRKIICIGAPKIFEHISNNCESMSALLLDIDKRYLEFIGPLEFCCYNLFNHHFFLPYSKQIFEDFLRISSEKIAIVMDPPFGGRVEPIVTTLNAINNKFKALNQKEDDIPIMWIFPYFMESHITNSLPKFQMLDYKVNYENHSLFKNGSKGRKYGSPVRIFTNLDPSCIKLPENEGYKYCKFCKKWVSEENKHCSICDFCTSKDGRTYQHCKDCNRCVKPSWVHCKDCQRCVQANDHKCGEIEFLQECFHCKGKGHKKRECPKVNHEELERKRKKVKHVKNNTKLKEKT